MLKSEPLKSDEEAAERYIEFGSSTVRPPEPTQNQRQPIWSLLAVTGTEYRIRSSRIDLLERLLEQTIKWVAASLISRRGPGTGIKIVEADLICEAPRTEYKMSDSRLIWWSGPQNGIQNEWQPIWPIGAVPGTLKKMSSGWHAKAFEVKQTMSGDPFTFPNQALLRWRHKQQNQWAEFSLRRRYANDTVQS